MILEHVYVDNVITYEKFQITKKAQRHGNKWGHLWCDPGFEEDLHKVAMAIGMDRSWFQNKINFPHYDIVAGKRHQAIAEGAQQMDLKEWCKKFMERWHQEHTKIG